MRYRVSMPFIYSQHLLDSTMAKMGAKVAERNLMFLLSHSTDS